MITLYLYIKNINLIFLISILVTSANVACANYKVPNPDLNPTDVLILQLEALKNNNVPFDDFGIGQTYEFAHPKNKAVTGPLQRFKRMIYDKHYKVLINHKAYTFNLISNSQSVAIFKVKIVDAKNKSFDFIWNISKFTAAGVLKNCWLTLSVSIPLKNNNSI